MSIEKMEYVNISGEEKELDTVLEKLSECGCFHIESAGGSKIKAVSSQREENPYNGILSEISEIWTMTRMKSESVQLGDSFKDNISENEKYIFGITSKLKEFIAKKNEVAENIAKYELALNQVNHLQGLHEDFQKIFSCEHIKFRFGRLPIESYEKLPYYDDKVFYFEHYTEDGDYYWGIYLTPVSCVEEIDEIFDSLYFERVRIAGFVHGTSEDAVAELTEEINKFSEEKEALESQIADMMDFEKPRIDEIFTYYKSHHDNFDLRSKALISNGRFTIVGFVPKSDSERFAKLLSGVKGVSTVLQPADANGKIAPPIKLKNNRFSQPFSLFVEMYGLPAYNGVNPTMLVALTYTLFFGIMFGDVGHGICLAVLGAVMWKKKKWSLGPILTRVGISGAVFGLLYGSVFGFEEVLDPVYEALGITFLPFKVMENVTTILIGGIVVGVIIMFIAILINIITGIRNRQYESALFSNNGIAGFVFFGSLLIGAVCELFGVHVMNAAYVLILIVLPIVAMFLREPLSCWTRGKKFRLEGGVGDFIAANFFEVFEFLLGYATNTLSFVRVGGFVLSHASMMLVVMALSEQVAAGAVPIVVIIGNVFVMGIEGLLVGIQSLRLEFYEIFSRFYSGGGTPFTPVKINYDEPIE